MYHSPTANRLFWVTFSIQVLNHLGSSYHHYLNEVTHRMLFSSVTVTTNCHHHRPSILPVNGGVCQYCHVNQSKIEWVNHCSSPHFFARRTDFSSCCCSQNPHCHHCCSIDSAATHLPRHTRSLSQVFPAWILRVFALHPKTPRRPPHRHRLRPSASTNLSIGCWTFQCPNDATHVLGGNKNKTNNGGGRR